MEFLKDEKILSNDKKILSFNFVRQYSLYLQYDMQKLKDNIEGKKYMGMENLSFDFTYHTANVDGIDR